MTPVTEALSAGVATSTTAEGDVSPVSIADELFSNLLQEVHMVKSHVFRVPDALPIFLVRQLEERVRLLNQYRGGSAVRDG
jgi:hypothetical protein